MRIELHFLISVHVENTKASIYPLQCTTNTCCQVNFQVWKMHSGLPSYHQVNIMDLSLTGRIVILNLCQFLVRHISRSVMTEMRQILPNSCAWLCCSIKQLNVQVENRHAFANYVVLRTANRILVFKCKKIEWIRNAMQNFANQLHFDL